MGGEDWARGTTLVRPDVRTPDRGGAFVEFIVYREDYEVDRCQRIFMSHKGADKPLVREYSEVLKTLGFDPWLDEDDMPAGTELHRGIIDGFHLSCAAIFFITPRFKDDKYLRQEINYAISEKLKKDKKFAIISVELPEDGQTVKIPRLLEPYVYIQHASQLNVLKRILKALPITVGAVGWRPDLNTISDDSKPRLASFRINTHDVYFRFQKQDVSGSSVPSKKSDAVYLSYWFKLDIFNPRDENVGVFDVKIAFAKHGKVLLELIATEHTGQTRHGANYCPDVTSLTLPSKDWMKMTFQGGIGKEELKVIEDCDEISFIAKTVEGEELRTFLAQEIIQAE